MAMMTAAIGAIVGMGALSAAGSIMSGNAEAKSIKRQGEYNAQVYEQQAEMVNQQKKLQEYQDNRAAAKMRGAVAARIGKSGFELGGSPLAVMVDNEIQMEMDKQIGQYNLSMQQHFLKTQSTFTRYEAGEKSRLAKTSGYSNAFKTMLSTASTAASYGTMAGSGTGAGAYANNSGQAYASQRFFMGV